MTVNVAGEFTLNPFDREDPADPIGQLVGVALATGDATGGDLSVQFSLPEQFAYIIVAASMFSDVGAATSHRYFMQAGTLVNGLVERYAQSVDVPSINGREESTFFVPRMITLPRAAVPSLTFGMANALGVDIVGNFRGLVFTRATVIREPSSTWRDWIT